MQRLPFVRRPSGRLAALFAAALALVAPARLARAETANPYGVNAHIPDDATLDKIAASGLGWARVDFAWANVEPRPGVYNWAPFDRIVAGAQARGIQLLPVLGYTPAWAAAGSGSASPPRDPAEWSRFVATIVARYRGSIRAWSLWNEPNLAQFFTGSLDTYIDRVLIPGASAVHTADPSAFVVGPELAHLGNWNSWLDQVLRRAGGAIDVIAHHCYKDSASEVFRHLDGFKWPWEKPSVQKVVRSAGYGWKPFWLTESGWQSGPIGEGSQAQRVNDLLDRRDRDGWVAKVFIYEMVDNSDHTGTTWGLLRQDLSEKPAYWSVRQHATTHGPYAPPTPSTAASRFVATSFGDFLGRVPRADELGFFGALVDSGRRSTAVAWTIGTGECRRERVRGLYRLHLGRDADPSGLASSVTAWDRGSGFGDLRAGMLASDEYFARAGRTPAGFVAQVYQDVLGRAPDPSGLAAFVPLAARGDRASVARAVLFSDERFGRLVGERFQLLLRTAPDPASLASYKWSLAHGLSEEGLDAAIASSDPYWARAAR